MSLNLKGILNFKLQIGIDFRCLKKITGDFVQTDHHFQPQYTTNRQFVSIKWLDLFPTLVKYMSATIFFIHIRYKTLYIGVFEGHNFKYFGHCLVLNCEIHQKVFIFIYVNLQFKSELKENDFVVAISESPLRYKYIK